jgi:hypothetical protein
MILCYSGATRNWEESVGEAYHLLLIPSPQSPMPIRHVRYPQDAEIVGRVTVITMRIAAAQPDPSGELS